MTSEEIKTYFEIAKPFVEPIISTIIKPQIKKLSKWLKKTSVDTTIFYSDVEEKFIHYLSLTHRYCSIINTLVFPNQQIKIEDIYHPLTIVSTKDNGNFTINLSGGQALFTNNKRVLISDTAGMGKSTLMKWISLKLIERSESVPILIELRKLSKHNSVLDEIYNQISPVDKSFDKDLIIRLLEFGFFTIIFDGFDEIPQDIQQDTIEELRDFINKVPLNTFIITSRPESALSSFGDFQMFYIRPLKPTESYDIIRRYDNLNKINYADKLIDEVKIRLDQIQEFLTNPFLVSLLYKSYTYNKDIPSKKTTFYEEVYSSLFKHHDSSKDGFKRPKISKLDILDFRIILRHLAFETAKLVKVIYTEPELLSFISSAKSKAINIQFKESDYLEDLLTTVPMFLRDGLQIKWAHKSIQDYFAAEYITFHSKKEEILKRIYYSGKNNYLNILDLIYELDPKIFRKIVMLPLLNSFVKHFENTYKTFEGFPEHILAERKAKTFDSSFCVLNCGANTSIDFAEANQLYKEVVIDLKPEVFIGATRLMGDNIYILSTKGFDYEILNVINKKNENLFIEVSIKHSNFESIKKLAIGKAFLVDDNSSSAINSRKIFGEINTLMNYQYDSRNDTNKLQLLDYKKSKKVIAQIKREIKVDESNEDFNDI